MRLRILSDLHLECFDERPELPDVACDAVILAGDISRKTEGLNWAAERFTEIPVIYVPGNHEFYHSCMPTLRQDLAIEAQRLGIYFLDDQAITLNGVRFYGTTFWTDFDLYAGLPDNYPLLIEEKALSLLPDFNIIEHPVDSTLTPLKSRQLHKESLAWLEQELAHPFSGPRVVISHHAPLSQCIPPCYRGDTLSPAFASNLPTLMGKMALWIHGHVHEPVDMNIAGTRIIANPGGYPNEFDPPYLYPI
ncbi:metallophosphoesterase [Halomonas garicola]|uniref:metallophosphoesterase n=1 Tax=Halomonas garicola TaxID=1690008 RepID=UPI00289A6806|nr:metallophosphoesterase [Halomonas garicola]